MSVGALSVGNDSLLQGAASGFETEADEIWEDEDVKPSTPVARHGWQASSPAEVLDTSGNGSFAFSHDDFDEDGPNEDEAPAVLFEDRLAFADALERACLLQDRHQVLAVRRGISQVCCTRRHAYSFSLGLGFVPFLVSILFARAPHHFSSLLAI